ncbi:hypothetical protein CLG96_12750 [Sphingomonas oleivorans]|uniref:Copper-binding protein n=1 Tax=Sphingomonas oleivorans TaxID=1735121 RepID=A0A2T5FW49_9SPHN|nr:hypothetical protein [Sphingomonas oleivorans]PTQ10008.1 hypothetical protein CLG96_12750 [Sphingomonas oleivorans]
MKKSVLSLALASLLAIGAQPALAHGNMKPQHGGQVQMVGETLFELAVTPAGAALYVSEDDEPVNSAAMTAKLSITAAGKKQDVAMTPAGANKFEAKGVKLPKGASVAVMVIDKQSQARSGATFAVK